MKMLSILLVVGLLVSCASLSEEQEAVVIGVCIVGAVVVSSMVVEQVARDVVLEEIRESSNEQRR